MIDRTTRRSLCHAGVVQGMDRIAAALGTVWAIVDERGNLIAGDSSASHAPSLSIEQAKGASLTAHEHLAVLHAALSGLLDMEHERRVLATEALDMYREVNLLFHIHEVIGSTLDYPQIVRQLVEESERLVSGTQGLLLLKSESGEELVVVAGHSERHRERLHLNEGIAGSAFTNRQADIIERTVASPYFAGETDFASMMVAPVRIAGMDMGVLVLCSDRPSAFTANDLKLLSTLASHGAIVLENVRLYEELRELFHSTVYTLAETIEKRDPYTRGHTQRVMEYSLMIAEALDMPRKEFEELRLSAVLHDVGKIAVRDIVLLKQSRLDSEEFELMKRHTEHGADILNHSRQLAGIVDGVRFHHERYDGKGYNHGLSGEGIPLMARIISVADAFDAMTTDRPYHKGMTFSIAAEEMRKGSGTQFDPALLDIFLARLKIRYPDRLTSD